MNKKQLTAKVSKWMAGTALAIILLFLLLATLVYVPPIQNLLKNFATDYLTEETGMKVSIDKVRLSFPLDLLVEDMSAVDGGDTLVAAQQLLLDIKLMPLFKSVVELNGFELRNAKLNSKSYISDTHIEGRFNLLAIDNPASCNLATNKIDVNQIRFKNADISIVLSDTARQDTTKSAPSPWVINVNKALLQNTRFYLQTPGDSMHVSANIKKLSLSNALVNLKKQIYRVGNIDFMGQDIAYDIPYMAKAKAVNRNLRPLDFNHLYFDTLCLKAKDFSFANQAVDLNLQRLGLIEKSGLTVNNLSTTLHYDSTQISIKNTSLTTPTSKFSADVSLPFSAIKQQAHGNMEAKIKGSVGKRDINILTNYSLNSILAKYPNKPLNIDLRAEGSMSDLTIDYCNISLPNSIDLRLNGTAHQLLSDKGRRGKLHYSTSLKDVSFINNIIPSNLRGTIHIPNNLRMGGDISFNGNSYKLTRNTIYQGNGSLSFDGTFSARNMAYAGKVEAHQFPLHSFLPGMSVSPLTAQFEVRGHGTDFLNRGTNVVSKGKISQFAFDGIPLNNITLNADLKGTNAQADITSDNSWLKADIKLTAQRQGNETYATLQGFVDQFALNFGNTDTIGGKKPTDLSLIMGIDLQARFNSKTDAISLAGNINPLNAVTPTKGYPGSNLQIDFTTDQHSTFAFLNSGDMTLSLDAKESISGIIDDFSNYAAQLANQFTSAHFNTDTLKTLLPDLNLSIQATRNNPLQQIMALQGYSFDSLYARVSTNKTNGINADLDLTSLQAGSILLEESKVKISQDQEHLKLNAFIKNSKRKNPNKFTASIDGELLSNGFSILANFIDANGKQGLNIGTRATFNQQGDVTLNLIPEVSTIAYRKFKVNPDNYITIDHEKFLTANVNLLADDNTALKLFSMPTDSTNKHDVTLSIAHLNLRDLSSVIPFMPKMAGYLSGDVHLLKQDSTFTAVAALDTKDLEYEGTQIGTLGTELFYMPEDDGHYVVAQILSDNKEIAVLDGHYYSEAAGKLDASLTLNNMPCNLLNPLFGNNGTIALSGNLNGEITVNGPLNKLLFNGQLSPDSIHTYSDLYGFDLAMENRDITINDSKIQFKDMAFYSKGKNPLYINGDIDFNDFSNMLIDLKVNAADYEIINSRKTKKSMVYGKVFVDLDATIKGKAGFIVFRGNVGILESTNVTYVMTDTPLQVEDQFNGLVEFTNFSEPEENVQEQAPLSGTFVNLNVNIDELAHLHCELSADGKSYVDCTGGGDLTLRIFPSGEMALLGRFNINSGEMKYTLPFIPLKTFTFTEGNYIVFTGDPSNPTLNITALENTKASVSDDNGASRMVAFKVGVAITRQLSDMGLQFLIDAPEDLEVQNELSTMSAETKNKLAITMLATGMYASNTNKSGFKATNALNAFLESEIQNIAGSTLKTIDISVGVEGNTTSTGETQTDYTFQFSKKLWNDRVTFIFGGKVSTGATDESSSQSFIDNISLEYRLDKNNSRYIRLFYDNDTYDPLEGRYSSAGAGYIIRRKTNSFGDLIIFRRKKK